MIIAEKHEYKEKTDHGFGFFVAHQVIPLVFLFLICLPFFSARYGEAVAPEPIRNQVLSAEIIEARGDEVPPPLLASPKLIAPLVTDSVNAKSFIVYDEATGQVLASKNTTDAHPIASLTKLLTGWVAYKYLDINEPLIVSLEDQTSIRPVLGLAVGDHVLPVDLIHSMLVGSANDAALALAHAVEQKTGKSFTFLMNYEAFDLGMTQSNFSNPVGFDSNYNYATAEDVVKLIRATQNLPIFTMESRGLSYAFTSTQGRAYRVRATNKLISKHSDIYAIKTGFTGEARGAMAIKVENSGHPFVILVLQSEARESDVLKLKAAIEQSYNWE